MIRKIAKNLKMKIKKIMMMHPKKVRKMTMGKEAKRR
jgi:hypothetical protein